MKPLLAISSWPQAAMQGDHQASRETWLAGVIVIGGEPAPIAYRFFMGDGTRVHDSEELNAAWEGRLEHYRHKAGESYRINYWPLADEVMLPIPWDFKHMALKTREIVRWALEHEYAPLFKVDTDTYVDIPRLLATDYVEHDYIGFPFQRDGWAQASGGAGYWLSKRAMEIIADAEVDMAYEDTWVGTVLRSHGIILHQDMRYRVGWPHDLHEAPSEQNDHITLHLGFSPDPFDNREMIAVHRLRYAQ